MSEFDIKGEVNIQTLPVSIATVRLGVDGAPERVVDRRPTGVHVQELRIGGRTVPLKASGGSRASRSTARRSVGSVTIGTRVAVGSMVPRCTWSG
jgi:hypothetical protein